MLLTDIKKASIFIYFIYFYGQKTFVINWGIQCLLQHISNLPLLWSFPQIQASENWTHSLTRLPLHYSTVGSRHFFISGVWKIPQKLFLVLFLPHILFGAILPFSIFCMYAPRVQLFIVLDCHSTLFQNLFSSIYLSLNAYASQKEKSEFKLKYIVWDFTIIPSGVQAAGMTFTCASQASFRKGKNAYDFQKGKLKRFILIVRIRDNVWINLQRRT